MSSVNVKTISLCIFLFLASALVSVSFRSSHYKHNWLPSSRKDTLHRGRIGVKIPRVAFATFLAGVPNENRKATDEESAEIDDEDDGYFQGARVMVYQLLHSKTAATNNSIPVLVLCTRDVSKRKRDKLRKEGATVVLVEKLSADWAHAAIPRWIDNLVKLRLFQLTEYNKIAFIDADTLITKPLDGVFFDEATLTQATVPNQAQIHEDEAELPRTYMFASHGDFYGYNHPYPPNADLTYLNGGFFVFTPSLVLFNYYMSLLEKPGKFDAGFMEQNLLNYAHRRDGNMPWKPLWYGWNVNWPTANDWRGGAKSFHAKYWDGDPSHDPVLKAIWREQKAEMDGFYRGRDQAGR